MTPYLRGQNKVSPNFYIGYARFQFETYETRGSQNLVTAWLLAYTRNQMFRMMRGASPVSREHRDVVTSKRGVDHLSITFRPGTNLIAK